jgi:hypothetical protein
MTLDSAHSSKRHPALLFAILVAAVECIGLVAYGISIVISASTVGSSGAQGSDVSPTVLLVVFVLFAALIGLVVRALWRGKGSARTAYLLTQGFGIVIAQTLVSGSEPFEKVVGWALIVVALGGAISILTPAASRGLNLTR